MQKQASEIEQENRFYSDIDIMKFHKQRTRNGKLNRDCEHVIRYGRPVALTWEQREAFIQNICDIPNRPVRLSDFCGMTVYVCIFLLILPFVYQVSESDELIYEEPEKLAIHERQHPVGGYITGMLINIKGREHFFAI